MGVICIFGETQQLGGASVSPSPCPGFPSSGAVGAMFPLQHTEGWGCCPAKPSHPTSWSSMDWWAGQADTENHAWYAKEVQQAWEIHFSQALLIPIYSLLHARSCEGGHRKPRSSNILLCLSNLTIASIQITFFHYFYRSSLVRSKEQLRDFLRDWLSTIHVRLQQT